MSASRFSRLKFKIHNLKGLVVTTYPVLLSYKAIADAQKSLKDTDLDKVLRYIFYLYDRESEIIQEIQDLKERKTEAMDLAGIVKSDKKIIAGLENNEQPYIGLIHCFFLEIVHSRKYREWHTAGEELDDLTRQRWNKDEMKKLSSKQRSDLINLCDEIHKKMDALEEEIFGDNTDVKESVVVDRWSSPERFAAPTLKLING